MLPYAALIFDCDGTLANSIPVHIQTWVAALRSLGADLSEEWLYERRGMSAVELIQTLNSTFGYELDAMLVNTDRQRRYYDLVHTVVEIQVVADIARNHYGKVPMAVASGGDRAMVEATLDAIGLKSLFDTVVTINDVTQGKPAPDIFLLAAKRLGVGPENCIVYEDSEAGLEAAHRAGMRAIDLRGL
jgi:beta-phosphoglucomutase-like phosphatase (HAD superfamily)